MSIAETIGVIWFEIGFGLTLCCIPYFVYISSLWIYILAVIAMYVCVRIVQSQTGRNIDIEGQGVFITGCDTGFGHDLAERLDFIGFTVFAGCLNESGQGAKRLKSICSKRLHIIPLDVGDDKQVENALKTVQKYLPKTGLWAIVNNAGFNIMGDVELCTIKMYHKAMNVNFYGYIRVIRAFLPLIRRSRGRVINVSSVRGRFSLAGDSAYFVTKHAIETLSDSLRLEMVKFGVNVSIIEPGHFGGITACNDANMMKRYREQLDEMWECASEDFKRIHTRQYIENMLELQAKGPATTAPTTTPVINAMQDAVVNVSPRTRYLVPGTNGFIDYDAFFARVYGFLPTGIYDYLVIKWSGCDKVLEFSK